MNPFYFLRSIHANQRRELTSENERKVEEKEYDTASIACEEGNGELCWRTGLRGSEIYV